MNLTVLTIILLAMIGTGYTLFIKDERYDERIKVIVTVGLTIAGMTEIAQSLAYLASELPQG